MITPTVPPHRRISPVVYPRRFIMGRQPKACDRAPSQRELREIQDLKAQVTALLNDIKCHDEGMSTVQ